jgi:predicted adenylyl cyclase CyaB
VSSQKSEDSPAPSLAHKGNSVNSTSRGRRGILTAMTGKTEVRRRVMRKTPIETEAKWRLAGRPAVVRLRRNLRSAGGKFLGSDGEENFLLDRDGEVQTAGHVLRIRIVAKGARALLTWKGPARITRGIKSRVELEVAANDGHKMMDIFDRIGFSPSVAYPKVRETWGLRGAMIAIDHLPFGWFCEIEGTEAVIRRLAAELNLKDEDIEEEGYPSLMQEYLATNHK